MKKSIIGKNYIPNDTSYSINLSYPTRDVRLAGSSNPMNGEILENPKECKIVSEPYDFVIKSKLGDDGVSHEFINVEFEGDIFRVLYHERNIEASLLERIERQEEMVAIFTL